MDGRAEFLAGGGGGRSVEGPALEVGFDQPTGLTLGPGGVLFIVEPTRPRIGNLTPDGQVTTVFDPVR